MIGDLLRALWNFDPLALVLEHWRIAFGVLGVLAAVREHVKYRRHRRERQLRKWAS